MFTYTHIHAVPATESGLTLNLKRPGVGHSGVPNSILITVRHLLLANFAFLSLGARILRFETCSRALNSKMLALMEQTPVSSVPFDVPVHSRVLDPSF